jgi:hypothetical protein
MGVRTVKSTYPDEQLLLMWEAFKTNRTASKAENWLYVEHRFKISKVTLLRYLREGLLNRFAKDLEELHQVKKDVQQRQGARYRNQDKTTARASAKIAFSSRKQAPKPRTEDKEQEQGDLKVLRAFYEKRIALLPPASGNCKFPTNDTPGRYEFCSCYTIFQLFGGRANVPAAFIEFGDPLRSYCLMHAYVVILKTSKARLMSVVSPLVLSKAA